MQSEVIQEHLEQFVTAFIQRDRRARYLALLAMKGGVDRVRWELAHMRDLDARHCTKLAPDEQHAGLISARLAGLGAPDRCVLISEHPEWHGRQFILRQALEPVVGSGMATIVSCIPGKLAYYEDEEAGERYLCHRPGNS